MFVNSSQLKNLPVYTKSGDFLGRVEEVEIDVNSQMIARYIVKSSRIVKRITSQKLVIATNQVVSLDAKKLVVEDSLPGNARLVKEGAVG
ncbi:MAG TPA: PRC-barrel domain-containing protein [Patescibacteria group bacterium]|nr:PRC-barrel domain-containing protein [Patescibacteria group bacterium]